MNVIRFSQKIMKSSAGAALLATVLLAGCKSAMDKQIDVAKQQAAATGQAQQVVYTDKKGNTTIATVQPPAPGQKDQQVTIVTTPAAAGAATGNPAPVMSDGSPAPAAQASTSAAPAPGAAPVIRPADVNIPAGTVLPIRINQHISVKTTPPGATFTGELAESIRSDNGQIIAPRGTEVSGVVDASHRRGHFKGSSILELRLTSMELNGQRYRLATRDYIQSKKGKGKRTAAMIGGGSGLGMLVGGLATGGVGLVVGGLAGAGAGTAIAGTTGNRDIDLPAESLVNFRLAQDLAIEQD